MHLEVSRETCKATSLWKWMRVVDEARVDMWNFLCISAVWFVDLSVCPMLGSMRWIQGDTIEKTLTRRARVTMCFVFRSKRTLPSLKRFSCGSVMISDFEVLTVQRLMMLDRRFEKRRCTLR